MQGGEHFLTGKSGHLYVAENDVISFLVGHFHAFRAVFRHIHRMSLVFKYFLHQVSD